MTVGSGFTPDLLTPLLGARGLTGLLSRRITAGGDFHPALRNRNNIHFSPTGRKQMPLCGRVTKTSFIRR